MKELSLLSLRKNFQTKQRVFKKKSKSNDLTDKILTHLNLIGYVAWRQNTIGVFDVRKQIFRKNPKTKKGVSDIIGFHKLTATFIAIEIKIGRDKLSLEQKIFLKQVKNAKGIALVVNTFEDYLKQMT